MKILKATENITKVDIVKAGNAVTTAKDVVGVAFKLYGVILAEKEEIDDKSGEVKHTVVTILKTDLEEPFISSISPTLKTSAENILDNFDASEFEAGIPSILKTKKSNQGRNFVYVDLQ